MTPRRKAGEQAVRDLASKRSHLSLCAPMPADNCLCRLSTSLFCLPQQGSGAGPGRRCWEVPAGTALYAGDVENWRFGSVTCNLGTSVQSGFFMNLGKAGKIGCKPKSSLAGIHCAGLGYEVWMQTARIATRSMFKIAHNDKQNRQAGTQRGGHAGCPGWTPYHRIMNPTQVCLLALD